MNIVEIEVKQLALNSRNYRGPGDYYDVGLRQQFRENGYQLFSPLVVTAEGDKFEIVAGNRSFFNLISVATEDGHRPETLPCVVKEYANESEHMLAIGLANELQLAMSPIDLANWYQDLADAGMKQVDIARNCNTTQPRVSKLTKLLVLPEVLQDAVHHLAHAAHYAKQPLDQLVEAGVRHTVAEDGTVTIIGLTASAAFEILNALPKKAKRAKFVAFLEAQAETIIEISNTLNATQFGKAFIARAQAEGVIDKPKVEPPAKVEAPAKVEPPAKVEAPAKVEPQATESDSKAVVEAEATPTKGKADKARTVESVSSQVASNADPLTDLADPFAKIDEVAVDAPVVTEQAPVVRERTEDAAAVKVVADALREGNVSFVPEWNILLARHVQDAGVSLVEDLLNLGVLKVTK